MRERRWGGVAAGLGLLLVIALAIGAGYEQIARRRERERFPRVGQAVDIGGRRLNIDCAGEGDPAVILESDAMRPGYSWVGVERELARTGRTCWYDRAGYGWSDPAPAPHTSLASARDLHELLHAVGVRLPVVMVGDGFGTLNVRVYCGLYPAEVAAVALVNPIAETEEEMGVAGRIPFHLGYPPNVLLMAFERVGMIRLLARGGARRRPAARLLDPGEQATLAGLERLPSMKAAFLAEEGFSPALDEVRAAGTLGDLPLVVLSQGGVPGPRLSTRQREVPLEGVTNILAQAPESIVSAVEELRAEVGR